MSLASFYDGIIAKSQGKDSFSQNGWGSRRSQYRRFKAAQEELRIWSGDKVLDVGCGNADLYWFLHDLGIDVEYTGVDIVPKMIDLAARNGVEVELRDVVKTPYEDGRFDAVVCIGTVGAIEGSVDERWEYVNALVREGLKMSKFGLCLTFLTDRDGAKQDDGFHWYVPFSECLAQMGKIVPAEVGMRVCAEYHPHDVMFVLRHKTF